MDIFIDVHMLWPYEKSMAILRILMEEFNPPKIRFGPHFQNPANIKSVHIVNSIVLFHLNSTCLKTNIVEFLYDEAN